MKKTPLASVAVSTLAASLLAVPAAFAQTGGRTEVGASARVGVSAQTGAGPSGTVRTGTDGTLPPARSDNDAPPPTAAPLTTARGVITEAGVGGQVAYGRPGVVELGGNLGLTVAGNLTQFTLAPTVGWFFANNFQVSAIVGLNYVHSTTTNPVNGTEISSSSTSFNLLVEPSYHLPFTRRLFGFLGVGFGVDYASGRNTGFAVAPRLGVNILVGRSGILSPALQFLYSTASGRIDNGVDVGNTSFGLQVGYTIML